MSKEIDNKLKELQKEINKTKELYEKLKNDYSINKAFIENGNENSLKTLISNEIDSYRRETSKLQKRLNELDKCYKILLEKDNNNKSRLDYIKEIVSDNTINNIKEKINTINQSYSKIFNDKENIATILLEKYEEIDDAYNDLMVKEYGDKKNKIENLNEKIEDFLDKYYEIIGDEEDEEENSKYKNFILNYEDFKNKKSKLDGFYKTIFGSENENIKSLKEELENRKKQLKEIEEEAKKVIDLSSDAGLAAGFFKQVKQANHNKNRNLYFFAGAILFMAIFNFFTIDWKNLNNIDLVSAIVRLIINTPFIWAATVANINLNKYIKLEQEYAHKESLARSFERYKEQIQDLNINYEVNSDQIGSLMLKLLDTNIEAFKRNPSDNLEQIRVNNILIDEISKLFDKMKNKN
ncbi:hypothetical protein ACMU1B_001635 [Campylobacter jejuni]|uniref:hypothetical protein n=1 Tax=Campylobacter jejuni TaxID=197 RepID=UPI00073DC4CB|nr:hypothetical protein [Campylobacter jejuni]ALW49298.1 hypothetical protein RC01_04675 [Campylobacter jejuni]ALW65311.1 hypothetical protein RC32_04820 [Campylobacter jejuni]ALW68505.1 hypothetical protein RC06_04660 [Campylobacter jejuni]EAK8098993.1 hypothetical protein [Campylobacter jejuni]EAL0578647.1 hypothetical protein [Campylobacter jejuni]